MEDSHCTSIKKSRWKAEFMKKGATISEKSDILFLLPDLPPRPILSNFCPTLLDFRYHL